MSPRIRATHTLITHGWSLLFSPLMASSQQPITQSDVNSELQGTIDRDIVSQVKSLNPKIYPTHTPLPTPMQYNIHSANSTPQITIHNTDPFVHSFAWTSTPQNGHVPPQNGHVPTTQREQESPAHSAHSTITSHLNPDAKPFIPAPQTAVHTLFRKKQHTPRPTVILESVRSETNSDNRTGSNIEPQRSSKSSTHHTDKQY